MVSVAIATYNGEKYLKPQLDSIVNQTVVPDEIVIRDDRSTDNTLSVISQYEKAYPAIKWNVEKNPTNFGFIKNFFGALKECHGDIIILCDQDDIWRNDKVERTIEFFEDTNVLSLHNDIDIIDENDKVIQKGVLGYSKQKEKVSLKQFSSYLYYCGMSSSFRGSLLPEILSVDPATIPVHDWLVHALAVCHDGFYKSNEVLSFRRYHVDNVALNLDKTKREGLNQRIEVVDYYCWHYRLLNELMEKYGDRCSDIRYSERVKAVNYARLDYLKDKSLPRAIKNIRNLSYYPTKKAYVSDLLYLTHIF